MFGISNQEKRIKEVAQLVAREIDGSLMLQLDRISSVSTLTEQINRLKQEKVEQEIQRSKRDEEYARKEREIEHKIGLVKKQQELDIDEAKLKIREENLSVDKQRFADQMKFQSERFSSEVTYMKDLLEKIMDRLPSANFTGDLTKGRR